ncbi:hypothetical protein KA005_20895, partial [bacterium]|nr:hypothetical protein [bacterium]
MENLPLHSPCYECEIRNEDKNNERCQNCKKRIAYAQAMQLIPSETSNNIEEKRMSNEVIENIMTVQEIDVNCKGVLQDIEDLSKDDFPKRVGKRRGPKPMKDADPNKRSQLLMRFPAKYTYIHKELINIAEAEQRTISMQAVYFIKQGIDKYKENHNG